MREEQTESTDLLYGRWPVREALQAGRVLKLMLAQNSHGEAVQEIMALAKEKKIPFHWVDKMKLDKIAPGNHQGVVAYMAPLHFADFKSLLREVSKSKSQSPALLFLDGILDPQNVGAILRSAYYFGVQGVVIPKWRAATISGVVVRSSAGAAQFIPIAQVSNLAQSIEAAKEAGLWIAGADMGGEDVKTAQVPRPFGLVMGSEGEGLHQLIRKKCDLIVSLRRPLDFARGKQAEGTRINSLNVSAACAALLHWLS